jgi:hypothetical protein
VFCVAGSVERNQIEMRQVVPSQNDFLIDRRKSFEWLVVPALVPVLWHVEQSNLALEWGGAGQLARSKAGNCSVSKAAASAHSHFVLHQRLL